MHIYIYMDVDIFHINTVIFSIYYAFTVKINTCFVVNIGAYAFCGNPIKIV